MPRSDIRLTPSDIALRAANGEFNIAFCVAENIAIPKGLYRILLCKIFHLKVLLATHPGGLFWLSLMLCIKDLRLPAITLPTEHSEGGRERPDRRRWRDEGGERVAAVDKIEEERKPDDFIGHRNSKTDC